MKKTLLPAWLLPMTALCALLALGSIYRRIHVEERNKAAEISLEIETVQNLASAQGVAVDTALLRLKEKGLRSLVLSETLVSDLQNSRQIDMTLRPKGATFQVLEPDAARASALQQRLFESLKRRFPALTTLAGSDGSISISGELPSLATLRGASVGLDPDEVESARRAALRIVARYNNPIGATSTYVQATIDQAKKDGVAIFLPQGDQVLGRRQATKALEDALIRNGIYYASPEFARLGGDDNVIKDIPEMVVRLHSAQAAELDKMPLSEAVDRYARAARERNQRVLLLRPVSFAGDQPLTDMGDFIADVQKAIAKQGGGVGLAVPFRDSGVPRVLFVVLAMAMILPVWQGITALMPWPKVRLGLLAVIALLGLACWFPHARHFMAFAGTLAFPILAFLWLDENADKPAPLIYLVTTLISMVGGLCVAGLLNGLPFFIRADQFEGVKIAVFLPILVVGIFFFCRLGNLREALKNPITYGQAALGLILIAALAFMISRTGNDNPAGVSGAELKMRDVLDKILFVRPRSKEFLIGHPLLIVGISLLGWQRKRKGADSGASPIAGWVALTLMMGAVGQTDVVNTLCHLHTPVVLSLMRIAVGWLAGGILGTVLWLAIASQLKQTEQTLG